LSERPVTGLMHIHSTFSFDGKISLVELRDLCLEHGHSFAILTEHAEGMSRSEMEALVSECENLSDDSFILIPGLEVICEHNLHILAPGIRKYLSTTDPEKFIEQVHRSGGLAILAHPGRKTPESRVIDLNLDGIEIWNARHDGRFAPRMASLNLLRRINKQNGHVSGCCGLDLHEKAKFFNLHIRMEISDLTADDILDKLREGKFEISNGIININPEVSVNSFEKAFYTAVNNFCFSVKLAKIAGKKIKKHIF